MPMDDPNIETEVFPEEGMLAGLNDEIGASYETNEVAEPTTSPAVTTTIPG